MVSYTYKDGILSPECLAYWPRWLEVQLWMVLFLAVHSSAEKWCWVGNSDFYYSFKLEILIQLQNEPA